MKKKLGLRARRFVEHSQRVYWAKVISKGLAEVFLTVLAAETWVIETVKEFLCQITSKQ